MSKTITAALAAAFLGLAAGSASAQFANASLKGSYAIQAHGFDRNGVSDFGEFAARDRARWPIQLRGDTMKGEISWK
jgi:hypothetical protein